MALEEEQREMMKQNGYKGIGFKSVFGQQWIGICKTMNCYLDLIGITYYKNGWNPRWGIQKTKKKPIKQSLNLRGS